jgi:hypothetical protein
MTVLPDKPWEIIDDVWVLIKHGTVAIIAPVHPVYPNIFGYAATRYRYHLYDPRSLPHLKKIAYGESPSLVSNELFDDVEQAKTQAERFVDYSYQLNNEIKT